MTHLVRPSGYTSWNIFTGTRWLHIAYIYIYNTRIYIYIHMQIHNLYIYILVATANITESNMSELSRTQMHSFASGARSRELVIDTHGTSVPRRNIQVWETISWRDIEITSNHFCTQSVVPQIVSENQNSQQPKCQEPSDTKSWLPEKYADEKPKWPGQHREQNNSPKHTWMKKCNPKCPNSEVQSAAISTSFETYYILLSTVSGTAFWNMIALASFGRINSQ